MRLPRPLFAWALIAMSLGAPAYAHHPGENLDEAMGSKEQFFQAVDAPAPSFSLADADGRTVQLSSFADKIVVLNFIYASCPDVCPLHAEKIAEIQAMVNASPMKELVEFVSITTDPEKDTDEVMKDYGPTHGLDGANWVFLTRANGDPEDATRKLAEAYGLKFTLTEDGAQMHGVVTHIIDRGGRWAAKFHGLRFEPLNMVLYVNGLINAPPARKRNGNASLWDKLKGYFQ